MKKTIVIILLLSGLSSHAQYFNRIFSKDPIINLENFQTQHLYFGFFLGFNSYDFKIDYKTVGEDIRVDKNMGFNVGLIADLKLHEFVRLRFEPGLYYSERDFHYPKNYFPLATTPTPTDMLRKVSSTNLHFPLLIKFLSVRTGNVRPYLLGGVSETINLSSNSKSVNDNYENVFRTKRFTTNYEIGFGIDIFSEYFIFSPSVRGSFGVNDELIRDANPNSPWTGNIDSMQSRAIFVNFAFH